MPEPDRGADDGGGVGVGREAGDERAVDLDLVDRQPHQIEQRRVSGAEVVERKPHADLVQAVQSLGRGGGHRDALGDLEREPARVDLEVAERAGDHLLERMVLDVARGNVERDRHVDPGVDPLAKLGERGVDHPGGERMDDARLLGHRDEPIGRHHALARMVPAHERFDRLDGAGRERDLRLVVQHELALRDRTAQLAREP